MIDLECLKANYDRAAWEEITEGWTKSNVVPGAILAINALIDEVERLRRGECICTKCGLRQGGEHPNGDF